MSEVISKRLHVSGLTPQISAADLTSRFSSFGTVKALDGLGKLDGVGQTRPYAYLTLETTKSQLAKCLNLLSGTTWKGARLRIGEAKPDFRERIKRENEADNHSDSRPPKRRRLARGAQGLRAADMSLVSPESLRPGWRVTPLGRLVRPMRMRPLHPLPKSDPSLRQRRTTNSKRRAGKRKTLVRAGIKKLDPEEWGSTYLSGIMLESGSGFILPDKDVKKTDTSSSVMNEQHPRELASDDVHRISRSSPPSPSRHSPALTPHSSTGAVDGEFRDTEGQTRLGMDLVEEKTRALALLDSLFGASRITGQADQSGEDDWGGAESLSEMDADVKQPESTPMAKKVPNGEEDDEIEYVPRTAQARIMSKTSEDRGADAISELNPSSQNQETSAEAAKPDSQPLVHAMKLKEMFAPRPEDTGFSILGNLDLELDEELSTISAPPPPPPQPSSALLQQTTVGVSSATVHPPISALDTKSPFFFPHSLLPNSPLKLEPGDPRDIFSGKIDFFRTESDEEIRARWESRKVELTRDWKRRHREAVKSARRRGGAQD